MKNTEKPKIILINPYHKEWANTLPMGIAYLAAVVREKKYPVRVIDASVNSMNSKEIGEIIKKESPNIVGVSASTTQICSAWDILRETKKINPTILTILGGVHPTSLPEESLKNPFVDYVFRGESEESLIEFLEAIEKNELPVKVKGLSYKRGNKIIHNPLRKLIASLDELPLPARDLFPFPKKYNSPFMLKKNYATIVTSRGCPGTCLFCNKNIFGFAFRARSAKNVVDEMEYLYKKYNIEEFHISDDCFSWDTNRVREICNLIIKRKLKIKWACSNGIRVDRGSRDMFKLMHKAGCYRVSFGIESGDNEILKKIGKRINLSQVKKAFEYAQEAGMFTVALFMLGNYGENKETMLKTIDFAKTLKTDYAQFTIATPYPGTAFFALIEREGRFLIKDWNKFGIFEDPVVFEIGELKKELLLEMHKKAYKEFYFRPSQILFILKKRFKNFGVHDLKQLFFSAKKVLERIFYK